MPQEGHTIFSERARWSQSGFFSKKAVTTVAEESVRSGEVTPSDQPVNTKPGRGSAVTAVPVSPSLSCCAALPEILPPSPAEYCKAKLFRARNCAVTFISAETDVSVLSAVVTPSDQPVNTYPAFGLAVTAVPLSPSSTCCMLSPVILPPSPAE